MIDKILRVVKYKELLKPIQKRCLKGILERANNNRPLCKSQIKMLDESLKTIKCHLTDLACRNKKYSNDVTINKDIYQTKNAKFIEGSYRNYKSKLDKGRKFSGFLDSSGNKIYN